MTIWVPWRGHWEAPDADEEVRDVFAHYGAAAYFGQVLEVALVNFLVGRLLEEKECLLRSDLDAFYEKGRKMTLGALLQRIEEEKHDFPARLLDEVRETLHRRNYLAHHFFFECAAQFMDPPGRADMLAFLEQERAFLEAVTERVNVLIENKLAAHGISEAALAEAAEALLSDYRTHRG